MTTVDMQTVIPYLPLIRKEIRKNLGYISDGAREYIVEKVLKSFEKGIEIRGQNGKGSLVSLIKTVTYRRCMDYLREQYAYIKRQRKCPGKRVCPKKVRIEADELLRASRKFGIKIKHFSLLLAYSERLSRREMAIKFNLSEQQVKGRIEYTIKKTAREIQRYINRQRLISQRIRMVIS